MTERMTDIALQFKHFFTNCIDGRVLFARGSNKFYFGNKYKVYESDDLGKSCSLVAKLPVPMKRRLFGFSRLLRRLMRYELRSFAVLSDGSKLASSREGVYWGTDSDINLKSTILPDLGRVIYSPMAITADSNDRFIWGEYSMNPERKPVGIYASCDGGKTHELVHEFPAGQIRHVHQIIEDKYDKCFWVLTGDLDSESGILRLSWDFNNIEWIIKGEQLYRAVAAFPTSDKIIYGTDSELDENYICAMDKKTGEVEKICGIPGSCIYGTKMGKHLVLTTTVEPSAHIKTNMATLWLSSDGFKWQDYYRAEKDPWPCKLFQYGSIVLPRGQWDCDKIVFSGQALKGIDSKVCVADIVE